MSFIMRNLGWIFLAGFFAFMLFLISSNTPQKNIYSSGVSITSSGEEDLESLVNKIENQSGSNLDISNQIEDVREGGNIHSKTGAVINEEENTLSLFQKIFGKKEKDEKYKEVSNTNTTGTGKTITQTGTLIKDSITIELDKNNKTQVIGNLTKNTPKIIPANAIGNTSQIFPIPPTSKNLPGEDIVSAIGKNYSVGVSALKLNNKNFTQTVGFLRFGDTVKQIGTENNNACFEVEVLQSKNKANIGKKGYICKKYLSDITVLKDGDKALGFDIQNTSSIEQKDSDTTLTKVDFSKYPQTKIGDIITITRTGQLVLKEYTDLAAGDKIDQMTDFDAFGCFIAHVYESSYPTSRDMVGKICLQDIY